MTDGVVIVGGSLSGLTFALACAARGIRTRVLERGHGLRQSGSALGIDRSLLLRVIGMSPERQRDVDPFPPITEYRQATSWQALHAWLRNVARRRPEITLIDSFSISDAVQSDISATAVTSDGEWIDAQIIVGADGYRSVVRRAINPEQPNASYAGYLLWRGLISESNLPTATRWPPGNEGVALENEAGYRLVAYPVASGNHSLLPGKRLISFAWYDKTRDDLLRDTHCVSTTGQVLASLPSGNIPMQVRQELKDLAVQIWPEPWGTVIRHAIENEKLFGTPVAEYFPPRLHYGRVALIGDAAHVVSPATGMGFMAGVLDAEALVDSLANNCGATSDDFPRALEHYGQGRLQAAQELVTGSMEWSRAYLSGAKIPRRIEHHKFTKDKT